MDNILFSYLAAFWIYDPVLFQSGDNFMTSTQSAEFCAPSVMLFGSWYFVENNNWFICDVFVYLCICVFAEDAGGPGRPSVEHSPSPRPVMVAMRPGGTSDILPTREFLPFCSNQWNVQYSISVSWRKTNLKHIILYLKHPGLLVLVSMVVVARPEETTTSRISLAEKIFRKIGNWLL